MLARCIDIRAGEDGDTPNSKMIACTTSGSTPCVSPLVNGLEPTTTTLRTQIRRFSADWGGRHSQVRALSTPWRTGPDDRVRAMNARWPSSFGHVEVDWVGANMRHLGDDDASQADYERVPPSGEAR